MVVLGSRQWVVKKLAYCIISQLDCENFSQSALLTHCTILDLDKFWAHDLISKMKGLRSLLHPSVQTGYKTVVRLHTPCLEHRFQTFFFVSFTALLGVSWEEWRTQLMALYDVFGGSQWLPSGGIISSENLILSCSCKPWLHFHLSADWHKLSTSNVHVSVFHWLVSARKETKGMRTWIAGGISQCRYLSAARAPESGHLCARKLTQKVTHSDLEYLPSDFSLTHRNLIFLLGNL